MPEKEFNEHNSPFMETTDASRHTGVCRRGFVSYKNTHSLTHTVAATVTGEVADNVPVGLPMREVYSRFQFPINRRLWGVAWWVGGR